MNSAYSHIGVIGSGAWGTALAMVAGRAGRRVTLWGRDAATLEEIAARKTNSRYLPGITVEPTPGVTTDLAVVMAADAVLLTVPAQQLRPVLLTLAPFTRAKQPLVICAKGIEQGSGLLMPEVLAEIMPTARPALLSGPNIATEIAAGLPAAATLAAEDGTMARELCAALSGPAFRVYPTTDLTGVALAGAMKNVLTMAAGIVMGRGLGENARAALLSRGLAEMMRLGAAMGARPETMMGLSGVGDLSLTATRNYAFGVALGQGVPVDHLIGEGAKLAEGVATAAALAVRAAALQVELPISAAVLAVLQGAPVDEAVARLLMRPLPGEEFR